MDGSIIAGEPMEELLIVRGILEIGLKNCELRSEIYCQTLKQMNGNPSKSSIEKGWQLLSFMSRTFIPDKDAVCESVLGFFYQESALRIAAVCKSSLECTRIIVARDTVPSLIELEAVRAQKELKIVVQLPGGGNRVLALEQSTTADSVIATISEELGLSSVSYAHLYGLYEVYHSLERLIPPRTLLFDIISKWEQYGSTMTERNIPTAFSFLLRRNLFIDTEANNLNPEELEFEFQQAKITILKGQLPCREEDAIRLAAVLDKVSDCDGDGGFSATTIATQYIPKLLQHKHDVDTWASLVQGAVVAMEMEMKGSKLGRDDLVQMYCDAVRQLPLYGCAVFRVQHIGQWALPIEVDLAVGKRGIQLLDPVSKDNFRFLPFTVLLKWQVTTAPGAISQLVVTTLQPIGSSDSPILLVQSAQAGDMALLMKEYNSVSKENAACVRALTDHLDESDPKLLCYKEGDILRVLEKVDQKWFKLEMIDTGNVGLVEISNVQIYHATDAALNPANEPVVGSRVVKVKTVTVGGGSSVVEEETHQKLWLEPFATLYFRKQATRPKKSSIVSRLRSKSLSAKSQPELDKNGVFNMEERLIYSKQLLTESLIDLESAELNDAAVEIFAQVQRVMGDLQTPKSWNGVVCELLAAAMMKKDIRDEFFCQVAKQITRNPHPSSVLPALKLVSLAAGCFVPTPQLYGPFEDLLTHLSADCTLFWQQTELGKGKGKGKALKTSGKPDSESNADVQKWVTDIRRRFESTWRSVGERESAPSLLEINAVCSYAPLSLPVQLSFSGPLINISVDSAVSVAELFDRVVQRLQIMNQENYSLYFYIGGGERCLIHDQEKVCDLISRGERVQNSLSQKRYTPFGESLPYGFRIRGRHMPHHLQPSDVVELDSVFYTAVEGVLYGRYPTNLEEALELGGLIAQATHGDYNPANSIINEDTLQRFIRMDYLTAGHTKDFLAEELNSHHASLLGTPAAEAKTKFLVTYSKWKWAEVSFFSVQQPKRTPCEFIFAVTCDRIIFLDSSDMKQLEEHEFDVISTWGFTKSSFNIKVGSLMKPINMIFDTTQGAEICLVLKSRVETYKYSKYKYSLAAGNSPEQLDILKSLGRDMLSTSPPSSPNSSPSSPDFTKAHSNANPPTVTPIPKKPIIPNLQLARAMMLSAD